MTTHRRQILWAIVGLLVGVVVAMVLSVPVVTAQIRSTQVSNTAKSDSRDEALKIVKDCVEVGGECYERGQAQTAAILTSAQQIIVLAAACAVDADAADPVETRVRKISTCIARRLNSSP